MEPGTIFFSYSRKDADKFASRLAQDLRLAGANIWIDQLDIQPGKNWDEEIEKALNASKYILFVASNQSVISQNVLNEIYYGLDENKVVIPIKIHNCNIPFRIRRFQYVDFTTDYIKALQRLITFLDLKVGNEEKRPLDKLKIDEQSPVKRKDDVKDKNLNPSNKIEEERTGVGKKDKPVSHDSDNEVHEHKKGHRSNAHTATTDNDFVPSVNKREVSSDQQVSPSSIANIRGLTVKYWWLILIIISLPTLILIIKISNRRSNKYTNRILSADSLNGNKSSIVVPFEENTSKKIDTNRNNQLTKESVQTSLYTNPSYPGGVKTLFHFFSGHIKYREGTATDNVETNIDLNFDLDSKGIVSDVHAQVNPPVDWAETSEFVNMVRISGRWNPASLNGRKVSTHVHLVLRCKLINENPDLPNFKVPNFRLVKWSYK